MLVKFQHLDASFFYVLTSSSKASPPKLAGGVSVFLPENIKPASQHHPGSHKLLDTDKSLPSGGKKFRKIYRPTNDILYKADSGSCSTSVFPVKKPAKKNDNGCSSVSKNKLGIVHTKRSTKWANYGGCIPSMLQALEDIKDVGEALKPWEEGLTKKERSIILKEQLSWERALEIFEWFKKKGCYELNVIHYNIMIKILGKGRKWSLLETLWNEMRSSGIAPINSTYGTLIDVYRKGGMREKALQWMNLMHKQGVVPDEITMGIVVQMHKKAGEFDKAEQYFINWSSTSGKSLRDKGTSRSSKTGAEEGAAAADNVSLSSYTYNTLIDTYGKAGRVREASEIFSRMLSDGIVPNTVTFNTMIHMFGNNGQLGEVTALMHRMEQLNCPLDTRTYNILISLHTKNDNINMAASYFARMKEARLEPDLVSYRTLLYAFLIRHMVSNAEDLISEMDERGLEIDEFTQSALTRMYIESKMLDKSWLWFERFHLGGSMTSDCYAANIDAFGERGHVAEAEKVFLCCKEAKRLNVLVFNVMLKAYGIGKKYDEACQLFDSMESYAVIPDNCSYNCLIQTLAGADMPYKARPYLRKMQEADLINDCIPYCAVISSFVKLGTSEDAEELFNEMSRCGVQPDIVVYGVLINAFADNGSVEKAKDYVQAMTKSGFHMNAVICNSLIKLYTRVGYLEAAQEAYKFLQSLEEGPDVYSSNCMIDLYGERSLVKEAEEIFRSLKEKGKANEFSFAMMLCMYKRIGWFDEAIEIAEEMRELRLLTDLLSYNNILGLYALDGRLKEALETFTEMKRSSIQPDDLTFKSLGASLMKRGISKQVIARLEEERQRDSQSGLEAWKSALYSVLSAGDESEGARND